VKRALSAVLLALAPSVAVHAQGPPPSTVRVDPVRATELQARRRVTGDVLPVRRARVAAEEAGRVLALEVDEGDHVEAGAVIARLDGTQLELDRAVLAAQRIVSEAQVTESEADLDLAARRLKNVEDLFGRKAATQNELDDVRSEHAAAAARLAQSRSGVAVLDAQIAQLSDRIDRQAIKAPFAGVVASVATEVGEWVAVGAPVLDIVSDESEAWLSVPQQFLAALRASTGPIEVNVGDTGGPAVSVRDWRLVPIVDPELRMLTVIAPLPAGTAAPGMSAQAWVPTSAKAKYLTISSGALLRNEIGPYLYVAVPGAEGAPMSAMPVSVEVLWREGERAVVAMQPEGLLRDGVSAIIEGKERLYPSAPVIPVDPTREADGSGRSSNGGGEQG